MKVFVVSKSNWKLWIILFVIQGLLIPIGCKSDTFVEPDELSSSLDKGGVKLVTELNGENELFPPGGDPEASGVANITLNQGQKLIWFEINVGNLSALSTAAHIHQAPAGMNGPPVISLTPPDESGFSSGTVINVDPELIKNIRLNPSEYYVNIHTTQFPAGAVRGQLMK